ncbi:hypothetical protein [Bacillus sp. TYF-LIM-B05]|uniref:hypothetical protein n=1 Tax=Bacillus sp. TYF-LIM-B05 TaxID=2306584 RepID=UPI000F0AFABE|nr:hypothetical protein [Bacillus sp. TYF-LIM-B05]
MKQERYVIRLIENEMFGSESGFIGYWTGKTHQAEDVCFPGVKENKHDKNVKIYTSKKRAENAVEKLKYKFTFVRDGQVEILD